MHARKSKRTTAEIQNSRWALGQFIISKSLKMFLSFIMRVNQKSNFGAKRNPKEIAFAK